MASLSILVLILLVSTFVGAWALSWSARAAGSSHARLHNGLAVIVFLNLSEVCFAIVGTAVKTTSHPLTVVIGWVLLIAQLVYGLLVIQFAFKLKLKRSLAPFGVNIAMSIAMVAFAVFLIKPFVVEAFVIPTKSMSPTLDPGDRIVINKWMRPRRFELVAYSSLGDHLPIFCKRVIGLPNEILRFNQGGLFVNDRQVTLPPVLAGRCHASLSGALLTQSRYQDGESISLGPDEYFFIGDNVNLAADSRIAGPSHAASLIGVADFAYWPLNKVRFFR